MSVAFRRESDDEHLEPKYELPIPPGPNLVTERGLAEIEARVAALEAALAEPMDEEARKKVQRDARYWLNRRATAQLVPPPNGEEVAVGTRVTYARDGQTRTITIVGHDESDPDTDRIAFTAPLVRAMLGSVEGDEVALADGQTLIIEAIEPA
ncbi:transcription elongation GreA/GreB family factor [Sphingomonas kaistensis]|uniref:Transcription elongation GreA/GreB family factor n=1 Tax=Sphingomonas kaistensis TaxID=298708 RepID=A0A7X5Y834_9SPHN|nr:GreA/GreB family elongation factor [Sphingomonas kaistensis]NJC06913.1 transcription elongation GreA/GreB family factor [Sphingomonas kaistensis]